MNLPESGDSSQQDRVNRIEINMELKMSYLISMGCALVLLLSCGGVEKPHPRSSESAPPVDTELEAIHALASAEAEKLGVPGMAVGIIRDGKLVSSKGYGTSADARRIDANTVFRIGSITKVFTATAAMRLRDEGKLSLDDPVAKHLPTLTAVLSPKGKEPVRVRHLLQHSSGIPTLGDGSLDWTQGPPITKAQLLTSVTNAKLNFQPGTKSEYSNVGMALAGVVVARASGTSYRSYVDENIIRPLQMTMTKWDRDGFSSHQVFPGHVRDGKVFTIPENYWVLGAVEPAGGLYSTVADMARFLSFQADPESAPTVLAAKTVDESHTKAEMPANNPMGIGWVVDKDADLGKVIWHNGATYSYGAWAGIDPERNNGVVIFVSTGDLGVVERAGQIGKDALRILAAFDPKYTKKMTPKGDPTDPKLVAEIGQRVMDLLNAPDKAKYEEIFSASFLKQQPAEEMRQFLVSAQGKIGRKCTKHELAEDGGGGKFKVKMFCANANIIVSLAVQLAPPHLLDGILIKPAP